MVGVGVGVVGSYLDVATLLVVVEWRVRASRRLGSLAAGVVALARREPGVDAARLQDDLGVDEPAVEAVEPTVVACGGEEIAG